MKYLITLVCLLSAQAQALELSCGSKYFNRSEVRTQLTAEASSEYELNNIVLKLDDEVITAAKLDGRNYSGRKYTNVVLFNLADSSVENKTDWGLRDLMLPQGWSKQDQFKAIITESASDGGSYNTVFCRVRK